MRQDAPDTLTPLARGELAGARELRLPGLREVPRDLFGLADTLEVLDIGGGELIDLPADFGRLRKLRVLFCSGNRFERMPPALGDCPALSQIGFRSCQLRDIPAESLPPRLRWLILTDNRLEQLPRTLGERPLLQKLMLSGNRLIALPDTLAGADSLELIRLGANRLDALPGWLCDLPSLAWASWSGNPLHAAGEAVQVRRIRWSEIEIGEALGEGASGRVHRALWRETAGAQMLPVAVKLFRGAITSDGLPDDEIDACLAAGDHPNLIGAHGRIDDHPSGDPALLTPLLPDGWRALAGPPSAESCSRDVYAPDFRMPPATLLRLARGVAAATAHLHARGVSHGDLYAHNILWDGVRGDCALSDFGAASRLPAGATGAAWRRIETRAFGLLLEELLDRCPESESPDESRAGLRNLAAACTQADVGARPAMDAVCAELARVAELN
jgi:hypothetical protein